MGASPEAYLAKLEPGTEVPAGKVRGLAAAAPALEAAGLVTTRKDGRAVLVMLTETGAARRTALAAAVPAKAAKVAKGKAPTAAQRLATLEATVTALAARVAMLEAGAPSPRTSGTPAEVAEVVLSAIGELDVRHRYGGLVPIPDVRAELRQRGVSDDATVNAAFDSLERAWKIDLSVAQSPNQVADRAAGIERPGRGLLYYVARR
jgi:hypothetical protein